MPEPTQNNEQSIVPFIPQGYLPIEGLEDPFTENILPRLFNDLPSLLRLSRVCRAFYHLIHQPSLLEKLFQHYALNPPTSLSLAAFGDDFLNTSLILPSYLRCASDTTAQTLNSPAPHNLIMKLFAAAVSQDPALLITLLQSKAANDLLHELKLDRVSFLLEIHPVETKKSPLSILQNNLPGSRETLDALHDFSGQTHRALLTCRRFDLLKAITTNTLKTGLSFTALELGDIAALTAVLEEVQRRWSGEQKDLAADDESRGVQ
ncbi:MAG: F-box protein, partial [Gammaproteobacteria bacterium]|nr:F-box protein [Gammaproteobacteria bacterium]